MASLISKFTLFPGGKLIIISPGIFSGSFRISFPGQVHGKGHEGAE
jgi:hypothetical protein